MRNWVEDRRLGIDESRRWALFLRHRETLQRFARRLAGNLQDAQDLTQDLALAIIAHPIGPKNEAVFGAWCRGLLRRVASRRWRSLARRIDREAPVGLSIDDYSEYDFQVDAEVKADLREQLATLAALDDFSLQLLQRRYVLGETSFEIARSLSQSPEAVRMKLMRLRAALRDASAAESDPDSEPPCSSGS